MTRHPYSQQNASSFWSSFDHVLTEQPLRLKYSFLDHGLLMLENLTQILLAAFELQENYAYW